MKNLRVVILSVACIFMLNVSLSSCGSKPSTQTASSKAGASESGSVSVSESFSDGDSTEELSSGSNSETSSDVLTSGTSKTSSSTTSKQIITKSEAQAEIKKLDLKGASIKMLTHLDPNGADARLLKSRFSQYCNGNIVMVTATYEKLGEKLSSLIMSGDSPDIYGIRNWDFPGLMYKDVFQELDSKINFSSNLWIGDKAQYDQYLWKGKHYIIGGASPIYFIWYNKRMMEEYGIDKDPGVLAKEGNWNWNTFLQIAKDMTDAQSGVYGFSDGGGSLVYALMSSLNEDIIKFTSNGIESNVKSANIAKANQFYRDLYVTYKVVNPSTNTIQDFANGKSAMMYAGNWEAQNDPIKKMHDNGEVTFTHIPKAVGAKNYIYPGSVGGYAVPVGAKNVTGAVAFLTMGQVSQAYEDEERAKWHKSSNHNAAEIAIIDAAMKCVNLPTYSYGINAASTSYWSALDELRKGASWPTLSEKLDPAVNKAIADLVK